MYWNEWKMNFPIFAILFLELWSILYWKLIENGPILRTKTTISQKLKIEIWFFIRFSTFRIFPVNMTTLEFFCSKTFYFLKRPIQVRKAMESLLTTVE